MNTRLKRILHQDTSDPKVSISLFGECATTTSASGRWGTLVSLLSEFGLRLAQVGDPSATMYIAVDHSQRHLRKVAALIPTQRRILVLREGPSIRPDQFKEKVLSKYGLVLSAGVIDGISYGYRHYEDGFLPREQLPRFKAQRLDNSICMVNTNKFSVHPASNYSLRQEAVEYAVQAGFKVTIAGSGWTDSLIWYGKCQVKSLLDSVQRQSEIDLSQIRMPFHRKLRSKIRRVGYVSSSVGFMRSFQFAIIIENDSFRITEKIFDALTAECIPIYYGPMFRTDEVPEDIFLRIADRDEILSVLRHAQSLSADRCNELRMNGKRWLESGHVQERWSEIRSMRHLLRVIADYQRNEIVNS